jgi:hypothetical protein
LIEENFFDKIFNHGDYLQAKEKKEKKGSWLFSQEEKGRKSFVEEEKKEKIQTNCLKCFLLKIG